jgi:hypothetical protein
MEPSTTPPTSQNPTDVSLTSVLAELDGAGFAGQFMPLEGGSVRCLTCRDEFAADRIEADQVRRLEGVSDPADMVIVVPLTCPHCATKGVLVAHYGAEASAEEGDVVVALTRTPRSGQGTDTPPGGTA